LYGHFARVVQFGGDHEELWVVEEDGKPLGFANWNTLGLPHMGKVYMDFLHCWEHSAAATALLGDHYLAFGERHNAKWYVYEPSSPAHIRLLERQLKKRGYDLTPTGIINSISQKMANEDGPPNQDDVGRFGPASSRSSNAHTKFPIGILNPCTRAFNYATSRWSRGSL
jgi:hypothetical protein